MAREMFQSSNVRIGGGLACLWFGGFCFSVFLARIIGTEGKSTFNLFVNPSTTAEDFMAFMVLALWIQPWVLFSWRMLRPYELPWGKADLLAIVGMLVLGNWAALSVILLRPRKAFWLRDAGAILAGLGVVTVFLLLLIRLVTCTISAFNVKAAWHWEPVASRIALVVLTLIGLVTSLIGPHVRRLELELPGLADEADGYTLCHLSDLHAGPLAGAGELRRLAAQVAGLGCRSIVLNGDVAEGTVELRQTEMTELLAMASSAPDGAYYVRGNHEFYNEGPRGGSVGADDWIQWWSTHGFMSLNNAHIDLPLSGTKWFTLAGIDDIVGSPDLQLALQGRTAGLPTVLMAHRPWPHVESAIQAKVDIQFSGHTHGGQFWPIHPAALQSANGYLSGLYNPKGSSLLLYVGDGAIGTYSSRLRLFSENEITVATFRKGPCEKCDRPGGFRQASLGVLLGQFGLVMMFVAPVAMLGNFIFTHHRHRFRSLCGKSRTVDGKEEGIE